MVFSQHVGINIFNLFPPSFCSCIQVQTSTGSVKTEMTAPLKSLCWHCTEAPLIFTEQTRRSHQRTRGYFGCFEVLWSFGAVHNTVCSPVPLLNLTVEWSAQGEEGHSNTQEASLISTKDPVSPGTHQLRNRHLLHMCGCSFSEESETKIKS